MKPHGPFQPARGLISLIALLVVSVLIAPLSAQSATPKDGSKGQLGSGQATLPEGLLMVQLKGNLVCPPLRMPGHGFLLACDDRTITLVSEQGKALWSLEMDRLIRGPLFALGDSMAVVALSGDQVVAFRLDGKKVWQKKLEGGSQSWFLGLPDARLVQVFTDGRLLLCNPDGSTLISLNTGAAILPVPQVIGSLVELRLSGDTAMQLRPSGELIAVKTDASRPVPVNGLSFTAAVPSSGSYAAHVRSGQASLDFVSKGELGHWVVDNRPPEMVVWSDSLWRCFMYRPQRTGASSYGMVPSSFRYGFGGFFQDLPGPMDLERRYLQALATDQPISGSQKLIEHVEQALASGRLAGKIQFYEDVLAWLIETESSRPNRDDTILVDAIRLMGRFPSLRHLPRMVEILDTIPDTRVAAAVMEFCSRLSTDPDGLILGAIGRAITRWANNGSLAGMVKPLRSLVVACGASWPIGQTATWIKASIDSLP